MRIETINKNDKTIPKNIFGILINKEKWPFQDESIDFIFNNLYLHTNENLENILKQYNKSLIKDGIFVSNILLSNSFQELKFTLDIAENERDGGISLNSLPLPNIESIGNLLGRIGFNLPSLSVNKYRLLFSGLDQIFEYLTQIGETNILINKRKIKSQNSLIAAMAIYRTVFNSKREKENYDIDLIDTRISRIDLRTKEDKELSNDHIYLTVEISSVIGWRYHENQQKPKERGSAEFSIKDLAIDVLEKDGNNDIRFGRIQLKEGQSDEFEILDITDKIKNKIISKVEKKILKQKGIINSEGNFKEDDLEKSEKK